MIHFKVSVMLIFRVRLKFFSGQWTNGLGSEQRSVMMWLNFDFTNSGNFMWRLLKNKIYLRGFAANFFGFVKYFMKKIKKQDMICFMSC